MLNENEFLIHAFFMGIYITFIYDILRILRRVFPHGVLLISLEDICFWIYCAVKVFLLMYHESNGTLRWFAVFGAVAGMLLYIKLASPFLVKYVSVVLRKLVDILEKTVGFLLRPVRYLIRRIREKVVRAARRRAVKLQKNRELRRGLLKKKLTFLKKVLKMEL